MCVKGPNIFETWGINMRLVRNMYSFAKMFASYSSSQLSVVLTSALKPQFKVETYHRSFSHFHQPEKRLFFRCLLVFSCTLDSFPSSLPDFSKEGRQEERDAYICVESHLQPALLYSIPWFGCREEAGLDCTELWSLMVIGTWAERQCHYHIYIKSWLSTERRSVYMFTATSANIQGKEREISIWKCQMWQIAIEVG